MAASTFQDWNLKDNPFAYSKGPLRPDADVGQLAYYFDFYTWDKDSAMPGFDANGRLKILTLDADHQTTTTFFISGEDGCGRRSMKNLLLFELSHRAGDNFLAAEAVAGRSTNRAQIAMSLAQAIIRTVRARSPSTADQMRDAAKDWKDLIVDNSEPDVESLFQTMKSILRQSLPDAWLVVFLDALNPSATQDSVLKTREMLEGIADFVILALINVDDALFIRLRYKQRQRVALWVVAKKVSADIMTRFLEKRFTDERLDPAVAHSKLHPFTPDAITTLFRTSDPGDPKEISLPLQVAIKKLESAMKRRLESGKPPGSPITADQLRAYFNGAGDAP
jgi:hypothetical protein